GRNGQGVWNYKGERSMRHKVEGRRHSFFGSFGLLATLALLMAIYCAPVTTAQAQQKTALRVAYIPVVTWLPALVAKEEGIFEKHDLDVTFTKFPTLVNLPGTLGKQFDLVPTTAPDLLNAVASGLNLAAVAGETLET